MRSGVVYYSHREGMTPQRKGSKKMTIKMTNDPNYPIAFDDSWGGVAHLDDDTVNNDNEWKQFIKELEKVREKVRKKY